MKKLLGIATLALLLAGSSFAQNLVTNGGFELGTPAGQVGNAYFPGWTGAGANGNADESTFLDNGFWSAAIHPDDPTPITPHGGSYMADFGAVKTTSGISQTIGTTAGHNYNVSFWLANDDGCSAPGAPEDCMSSITITFGGTTLIANTLEEAFGWTFFSFDVTATSDTSDLSFVVEQDPAYYYLDDVSVEETPEPASLTLLGSALSLGAGFIRKFRS